MNCFKIYQHYIILFELDLTKMTKIAFQSIICFVCFKLSTFENFKKSKKMNMSLLTYTLWIIINI